MYNEIWKDIPHYEGLYQVSNYGRIKNNRGQFKTQHDNGRGYLGVELWKNNSSKREYVHRLVALAFLPNPNHFTQVNHKDEDKQNNYVDNLEWCDCKYNNNYGTHTQRMVETCKERGVYEEFSQRMKKDNPNKGQFVGGKNGNAKKVICEDKVFDCIKDLAEYYNVKYSTMRSIMSKIKNNEDYPKKWKELGLRYS
ncbi:MAG: HNH endonuclease [Prevotellaceae bacterium]|nr:HNH endonuclease [Candidatus Faecinaster equi]